MSWFGDLALQWLPLSAVRQCGALPYRFDDGGLSVLLVTAKGGRRWILPKGWPKRFRSEASSAADEAYEEAGVRGSIAARAVGEFEHLKALRRKTLVCRVTVYPLLVDAVVESWPEAGRRERRWFSLSDARSAVDNPGLADLLDQFAAGLDLATAGRDAVAQERAGSSVTISSGKRSLELGETSSPTAASSPRTSTRV